MNFKEFLQEKSDTTIKDYVEKLDLKNGDKFLVVKRDKQHNQDPFMMYIVDSKYKVKKQIGTHPSQDGAMKYGKLHYS